MVVLPFFYCKIPRGGGYNGTRVVNYSGLLYFKEGEVSILGGLILLILFFLFIVGMVFVRTKINNTKYRLNQQILGKVGLSSSDMNANINAFQEQQALKKLLEAYPNFSEKYIKDTLYSFALCIINRQNNGYMSNKVLEQLTKDKLLDTFKALSFVRVNILGYKNNRLTAVIVFANSSDEYQIMLNITIQNNILYIDSYNSMRGMVKGL